uniref:Chaperone protein dnaj 15-like n=1 Tax=Tetraselmis sp. GSL018 TaxID=582737 RepID=A0A061R382_9CHLO
MTEAPSLRDPYVVLGLEKSATENEIKSAYKKCALKYHPDKNHGEGAEDAADKFKEAVTAYNILIDPDKRRRYDAGGFDNLEASELEVELDLSSMGPMNTFMAAMFAKLGVPIKTAVSQAVLDKASDGSFQSSQLEFERPVKGKVDKLEAVFFELNVTKEEVDEGFYIFAHSQNGSKFKLLLFEEDGSGGLQLKLQEDSTKTGKAGTTAGLFFLPFETYSLQHKLNPMEVADEPEAMLFKRLESLRPRETCALAPGKHTFAVYGDNWFKRVPFQIEAVRVQHPGTWDNAAVLRDVEQKLTEKRDEVKQFERDFRRVQSEYLDACQKFEQKAQEVEDLLHMRETAYISLYEIDKANTPVEKVKSKGQKASQSSGYEPGRTSSASGASGAREDPEAPDGTDGAKDRHGKPGKSRQGSLNGLRFRLFRGKA